MRHDEGPQAEIGAKRQFSAVHFGSGPHRLQAPLRLRLPGPLQGLLGLVLLPARGVGDNR